MQSIKFPWSDNWWIENDKAWFCAGEIGALFCVDIDSQKCELISRIPECDISNFRLYSYCIKYDNFVFCFPNVAQSIWYYDIERKTWVKIEINKEKQILMCMAADRMQHSRAWMLEDEIGRILEINLERKVMEREYQVPCKENIPVGEYVLVEEKLYCVNGHTVYCISNGNISSYEVPGVKADLYTICYDGTDFWLSGYCKEIYVWNPDCGIIKSIIEFPKQFGIYNFNKAETPRLDCDIFCNTEISFFMTSVALGRYVWFVPFRSDKIVYVDKENHKAKLLEIEDELETKESIEKNYMAHKFLLQYVREDRYIGLYSFKNGYIFEIDTVELCVKNKNYQLSNEAVSKIKQAIEDDNIQRRFAEGMRKYNQRKLLQEGKEWDRILYAELIRRGTERDTNAFLNIGETIYSKLN